jgi:NADH-quinone oxidoreductase subunit L
MNEVYGGSNMFGTFLALPDVVHHLSHQSEYLLGALNVTMGLMGMGLAYKLYADVPTAPKENVLWQRIVINKFYVDEFYDWMIVKPLLFKSRLFENVIDKQVFDGIINLLIFGYRSAGVMFASLQNGKVRYYALYILAGVAVMSLSMLSVLEGL